MADSESISLEETNKIRISLGLKPLTADSPPRDSEEQRAEKNYADRREQERKDAEAQRIKDKIDKARNKRELNRRLKGATLGDADADADDALKWVRSSKKREKELAEKRQKELESMDQVFQGEDYTEKDLQGLKVSHDLDAIEEGQDRILTLKDSRILDNEEDELFDAEMAEDEKDAKRHELKVKKRDYTGYDDDEFAAGNEGRKKAVLAKYDEDIDGAPETGFRLGAPSKPSKKAVREMQEQAAASVNKTLLSIDYSKNLQMSDYLQEGDVGFKKPKTKKKRSTRKIEADPSLLPAEGVNGSSSAMDNDKMDVDEKPITRTARVMDLDSNFVDDDELQAALARSRRAKTMKAVKRLAPEDMARQVIEEKREVTMAAVEDEPSAVADDDGLTFDDTSEFIRNISNRPVVVTIQTRPEAAREPEDKPKGAEDAAAEDEPMDEDEAVSELEAGEVDEDDIKDEEMDDEQMLMAIEEALTSAEAGLKEDAVNKEIGITDEPMAGGSGLAGALALLRQQGLVAKANGDSQDREKIQKDRDAWLAGHRHRLAQRELERLKSRGSNKDQATREYDNRLREQQDARESAELFKNYKPDVNIVYYDEFGRALTPKEAWKALSHRFHGKGSGRAKLEKRLKKIAEEKKKEAMASGDTPLGMNEAFQIRQQKVGQAHMVLSVGQRGAVPQVAELLDNQTLSKKAKEKAKKKDGTTNAKNRSTPSAESNGLVNLPVPSSVNLPGSPAFGSAEPSPSPLPERSMKPAFSRISLGSSQPASGGATPLQTADRTRVAFGLKRKAVDEGESTPPTKKR